MLKINASIVALAAISVGALLTVSADAHFVLQSPAAATMQNDLGNPQKTAPCGPNGNGTPTDEVTTYSPGETITIAIDEKIFHPGHYRVVLAVNDPNELPPAPPITPTPSDDCAATVIDNPAVFPVLADGMLMHTQAFGSPQSFEVTLPSDVECDNCTLQIIQYMSNHSAPCFYYHCANIAIQGQATTSSSSAATTTSGSGGAGGATAAGGSDGSGGNGSDPMSNDIADDGCGCTMVNSRGGFGAYALFFLAGGLVVSRLRRRQR